jgi:hypothetical protein
MKRTMKRNARRAVELTPRLLVSGVAETRLTLVHAKNAIPVFSCLLLFGLMDCAGLCTVWCRPEKGNRGEFNPMGVNHGSI